MAKLTLYACLLICTFSCHLGFAEETQIVTYAQDGARLPHEVELLQRALDLTQNEYGPAKVQQHEPESIIRFEMALAKGKFDVAFLPSSGQRERRMRAVKIPLTQGLLSYRLLVVRKDRATKLENAKTLEAFQTRLIGGVGIHWQSLQMYTRNKLLMKAAYTKDALYEMLVAGEIDYFPRGLNEILIESDAHSELFQQLTVSPDVALFYMLPRYVFVRHGVPKLAERIEKGLLMALDDGSFKSIFFKHFQDEIDMFNKLNVEKIIYLENQDTVISTPMKWHWWLEEVPPALLKKD